MAWRLPTSGATLEAQMTVMRGYVGYHEDLRQLVEPHGFGGKDGCDRLRTATFDPYRRDALVARLEADDRAAGAALDAWLADGCPRARGLSYASFFDELEAWTEFWDLCRPGTAGRFHRGDGHSEAGALGILLRDGGAYRRWTDHALSHREPIGVDRRNRFEATVTHPPIRSASLTVDLVLAHVYKQHFGHYSPSEGVRTFLDAMQRYGADTLPSTARRALRVPRADRRFELAHRYTMRDPEGWFHWGAALEGASVVDGAAEAPLARRAWMAGLVIGCASDYARRRRGRTRAIYAADAAEPWGLLRRGVALAGRFDEAAAELRDLYRIRERGEPARLDRAPHDERNEVA